MIIYNINYILHYLQNELHTRVLKYLLNTKLKSYMNKLNIVLCTSVAIENS